jgi:hypothetical protein
MYTVPQIIDIARVAQYLVRNDQARRGLLSGGTDPRWSRMLYIERRTVEWVYGSDPAEVSLEKAAYYVYALCGKWAQLALAAMRSAGVVPGSGAGAGVGVGPGAQNPLVLDFVYLIPITGADFASPTEYHNADIVGHSLEVYWNGVNRYLEAGEWTATATGLKILIEGFDATTTHTDASFKIYIKDPNIYGEAPAGGGTTTESGGVALPMGPAGAYTLAASSLLESVVLLPSAAAGVKIGTSAGSDDLMPEITVGTDGHLVTLDLFSLSGRTVHFTGLPAGSTVVVFVKKVNLS